MSDIQATARVKATVTFKLGQPWGNECTVGQILTQATREATEKLQQVLSKTGVRATGPIEVEIFLTGKVDD